VPIRKSYIHQHKGILLTLSLKKERELPNEKLADVRPKGGFRKGSILAIADLPYLICNLDFSDI